MPKTKRQKVRAPKEQMAPSGQKQRRIVFNLSQNTEIPVPDRKDEKYEILGGKSFPDPLPSKYDEREADLEYKEQKAATAIVTYLNSRDGDGKIDLRPSGARVTEANDKWAKYAQSRAQKGPDEPSVTKK